MFQSESKISGLGAVIWFTGLSGSGKTTLARALESLLCRRELICEVLDGDEIRKSLPHLGFSKNDRLSHVRNVAHLAAEAEKQKKIAVVALISPYEESRNYAKSISKNFFEVYLSTSLEACIRRDTKGLYQKALRGEIANFTGINDPYEIPEYPDLKIDTEISSIDEAVQRLVNMLSARFSLE